MKPGPTKKPHHHGDLREALIVAGIGILSDGGLPALTLRACAARAGVSHAAPAHHFQGLPGLVAAICARGFDLFTRSMIKSRNKAGQDPYARLEGICEGYLAFAAKSPALFALIFSADIDFTLDQELVDNSTQAYLVLSAACAPFSTGTDGSKRLEITIWSLVHGYASLMQKYRSECLRNDRMVLALTMYWLN